eukprot:TRINITY_DN11393_c0_g1_i1.p1 TRINITY_DN11393_c0_g1~~TRINITY_DN11393_c0_g1_i1.p1  ORF type:complete len:255 (+),score=35.77 TRINITY_DN11393_c0_g1_i1:398-1162(+)
MAREEYIALEERQISFLNKYIAKSPSEYYGGISYIEVKTQKIDEDKIRQGEGRLPPFDENHSVTFKIPPSENSRKLIPNYCIDSKYVGFAKDNYGGPSEVFFVDAETGAVVFHESLPKVDMISNRYQCMYDNYVAMIPMQEPTSYKFVILDFITGEKIKKNVGKPFTFSIMTRDEILIHCGDQLILWNYKTNTEKRYPSIKQTGLQIKMIYNDMWVALEKDKYEMVVSFYDMKDATRVGSVSLSHSSLSLNFLN